MPSTFQVSASKFKNLFSWAGLGTFLLLISLINACKLEMKHFTANACIANWKKKISHLFPAMYWSWKSRPKCFACWNTFSPFWALLAPCHLISDLWKIPWLSIPGRFSTSYDSSTSHPTLLEILRCTDWLVGCLQKIIYKWLEKSTTRQYSRPLMGSVPIKSKDKYS